MGVGSYLEITAKLILRRAPFALQSFEELQAEPCDAKPSVYTSLRSQIPLQGVLEYREEKKAKQRARQFSAPIEAPRPVQKPVQKPTQAPQQQQVFQYVPMHIPIPKPMAPALARALAGLWLK